MMKFMFFFLLIQKEIFNNDNNKNLEHFQLNQMSWKDYS